MTADKNDLRLVDVDLGNYYPIMMLEVADDQAEFAWTNSAPLAEAAYVPGFLPRALYLGDEPIGLGLVGPFYPGYVYDGPAEPGAYIIDHVMVDRHYQGKGYGRRLVELLVAETSARPDCRRVLLAVHPQNERALAMYRKMGFADIGRTHENDILMEFKTPAA